MVEEGIIRAEEIVFKQKMAQEVTTTYKTAEVRMTNTPIKTKEMSTQVSSIQLEKCEKIKFLGKLPANIFNGRVDLTDTGGSQLQMSVKWLLLGLPSAESIAGT